MGRLSKTGLAAPALLLGASLIANLVCCIQVSSLRGDLNWVKGALSNQGALSADIHSIRSQIALLEKAAEWYETPRIDIRASGSEGGPVARITWTFGQLGQDATVGLSYRFSGSWKEAQTRRVAGNAFEADIPLAEAGLEPRMEMQFRAAGQNRMQKAAVPVETASRSPQVEYVISSEEGGRERKSGRIESISLAKVAPTYVVEIVEQRKGIYSIVVQQQGGLDSSAGIYRATAAAVGGAEEQSVDLSRQSGGPVWSGLLQLRDGVTPERIRVTLTLTDGKTLTQETVTR